MDFSSLEIFCTVAEEGSVTRAAQRLNRVQSNVTTRVQQLEEQLNVALFQREGKRMELTAEGQRFIDYAQRLLSLAQEAMQSVNTAQPIGQLKIGAMEATAASRLPLPLAAFHANWPDVVLEISTGTSRQLLDEVAHHRLDCALVAIAPGELPATLADNLSGVAIWSEQLMLLEPKNAGGGKLSVWRPSGRDVPTGRQVKSGSGNRRRKACRSSKHILTTPSWPVLPPVPAPPSCRSPCWICTRT